MEWLGKLIPYLAPNGNLQFLILCIFLWFFAKLVIDYLTDRKSSNIGDSMTAYSATLEKSILSSCEVKFAPKAVEKAVSDLIVKHEELKEKQTESRLREERQEMQIKSIEQILNKLVDKVDGTLEQHNEVLRTQAKELRGLVEIMNKKDTKNG